MAKKLALKSFRLKNFKAIRDSGDVKFTPLTVLIGDNGSGKSSLVEGLRTYQTIVKDGLDAAMNEWRGFEYIVNPPLDYSSPKDGEWQLRRPIVFELSGYDFSGLWLSARTRKAKASSYRTLMTIGKDFDSELISIRKEVVHYRNRKVLDRCHKGDHPYLNDELHYGIPPDRAIISDAAMYQFAYGAKDDERIRNLMLYGIQFDWQFLTLNPWLMVEPRMIQRTGSIIRLRSDGANIAEYLHDIRERDADAFEGIIDAMKFVMPYMRDIKPGLTDFLGRQMHLTMKEAGFTVPGWLLSTGTMRILALLALFRHPNPPPVIVIEELENGLDPRCIHLIVEEIRNVVESGRSQVIITTHSPYLLDLLPLWSIVLAERVDGQPPSFTRPADDESLQRWSRRFGPGKLYTMGNFRSG